MIYIGPVNRGFVSLPVLCIVTVHIDSHVAALLANTVRGGPFDIWGGGGGG